MKWTRLDHLFVSATVTAIFLIVVTVLILSPQHS